MSESGRLVAKLDIPRQGVPRFFCCLTPEEMARHVRVSLLQGRRMNLLAELRLALRRLSKQPGFTVTTIATLALAIGANTAIFSVIDAVLMHPSGVDSPEHVAIMRTHYSRLGLDFPVVSGSRLYGRCLSYGQGRECRHCRLLLATTSIMTAQWSTLTVPRCHGNGSTFLEQSRFSAGLLRQKKTIRVRIKSPS